MLTLHQRGSFKVPLSLLSPRLVIIASITTLAGSDGTKRNSENFSQQRQHKVQSAAARVLQADRALRTGLVAFNGHLEGISQTRRLGEDVLVLTFRPQEAVYSLELLNTAFSEYYSTVAEYNRAQFDLFHALGYPAHEVAALRPIGEAVPVDTDRPAYLPRVGHGPPPASR